MVDGLLAGENVKLSEKDIRKWWDKLTWNEKEEIAQEDIPWSQSDTRMRSKIRKAYHERHKTE